MTGCEVTNALVKQAWCHGLFGQTHHAVMQYQRRAVSAHGRSTARGSRGSGAAPPARARISRGYLGLNVIGIGGNAFNISTGGIERRGPDVLTRTEFRHVGVIETADVDNRIFIVIRGDVECHDDRIVIGALDRERYRRIGVRGDAEVDIAEIDAVIPQLPLDDLIGKLTAAVACAHGGFGNLSIPEILFAQFLLRDLEKEALA